MKKMTFTLIPFLFASFFFLRKSPSGCGAAALADKQTDGPYVLYRNGQVVVKYIYDGSVVKEDSVSESQKSSLTLQVNSDQAGKQFSVKLKDHLENEKTETAVAGKLLALSDIEGNFTAFRKLLQTNGVIDADFNWTFSNGQVVLTGDFFDRGNQVTEVLWLIYSLEEKAKAAGGYLHYVLGNHEIMNLSGDLRYLNPKYPATAKTFNVRYETLYNENSELGRWLRTKNIVEKVGDILFMHGGISPEINKMNGSLDEINTIARPFYSDSSYKYPDPRTDLLFSDSGPFWYRGYFAKEKRATQQTVDSTLSIYKVNRLAIGHTIIADTISIWYNGKLIDTDVHHAEGKSEALLIEDGRLYRVNGIGEKFLMQ